MAPGEPQAIDAAAVLPPTVHRFLAGHEAAYGLVSHIHTRRSTESAEAAHVPGDRLAKAVILKDEAGYLMAVLPATRALDLGAVHRLLGRQVGLATETELGSVLPDCEPSAVPPLGPAYGLQTVVDERLLEEPELFLEAGDHEHLLRLDGGELRRLLGETRTAPISKAERF